jgi:(1->4)-alpha-D-glucan 1-alpha-D-glucosylmutase
VLYEQLERLTLDDSAVADAVRAEVDAVNADVDALDALLDRQNYRLAFWRTAGDELGYRRFFDINTLAALRVEDARVFADTHHLVLGWLSGGEVQGVRIDHPDGLRDPQAYFELLRAAAPDAWIVVEKILEPGETLPEAWPVDGTTGYDFCHLVTRLLHDARGEAPIRDFYDDLTGDPTPYEQMASLAKRAILDGSLASDVARVTDYFVAVCEAHRRWRDYTRRELREALVEVATSFPVYRSYVRPDGTAVPHDLEVIDAAVSAAVERRPDLDSELLSFLRSVLVGEVDRGPGPAAELRLRFQQLTGPVMAKGVEDTAFYDHVPLASLNEVGSDPSTFSLDPDEFHAAMHTAAVERPVSMLTLTTHDTKRSEDVRARLALLSEIPGAWSEAVRRWSTLVEPHRAVGEGVAGWPDPRMEHLLFQTLVGAHPLSTERAVEYMTKAVREAKRNTSWTEPHVEYDEAVVAFVTAVADDEVLADDIAAFVEPLLRPGWVNSLSQKLLLLTTPGVPDIYQGTELWDLSLVDPTTAGRSGTSTAGACSPNSTDSIPTRRGRAPTKDWPSCSSCSGPAGAHQSRRLLRQRLPAPGHRRRGHPRRSARRGTGVVTAVPRLPIGLDAAGRLGRHHHRAARRSLGRRLLDPGS